MKAKIKRLLDLLREFPEDLIIFNRDGECIYFDGRRFCLSSDEGANRIHDCWQKLSEEEALEILTNWAKQSKLEIAINYLTPPYEKGIDWFS